MSVSVTVNNVSYTIPQTSETGWGDNVTSWIQAVSSSTFQKSGGSFTLTAEADFGATFGLKVAYLKSQSSNPGSTGILRLGNTESIVWRNAANNADLALTVTAGNLLQFNSDSVVLATATQTLTNKTITIASSAGKVLIGDGSNNISSEATLAVSRGGTNLASYTTGDLPYASGATTIAKLPIGTSGQILKVSGGLPSWGSAASSLATNAKTANYTILNTDDALTGDSSGGAFTFTLPDCATNGGKVFYIKKIDSSFTAITITRAGSDTISDDSTGLTSTTLNTQGEEIMITSFGSTVWQILSRRIPAIEQTVTMASVVKGAVSDPTLATTPLVSVASFSRIGKYMQLNLAYRQTANTGAAAGSGQYIFLIPQSLTIDGTYVSTAGTFGVPVGSGSFNGSSLSGPVGVCRIHDSTHVTLQATTGQFASTTQPFTDASCEFSITALFPISGWNG